MKKRNLIITLEALVIIVLGVLLYRNICNNASSHSKTGGVGQFFHWPPVKLQGNERIISAYVQFQTVQIKSIMNIPPEWYTSLDLNEPPNPAFKGSIIVGGAALDSPNELPMLELENIDEGEKAKAIKVEYMVIDFTNDKGKERTIEVNLEKP